MLARWARSAAVGTACLAVALFGLAAPARAGQDSDAASPLWVRVTTASEKPIEGALLALDDKALTLRSSEPRPPIVLPRSAVERLDVRHRQGRKLMGVTLGGVAGGTIAFAMHPSDRACTFLCGLDVIDQLVNTLFGGAVGAVAGWLIAPAAQWEKGTRLDDVLGASPLGARVEAQAQGQKEPGRWSFTFNVSKNRGGAGDELVEGMRSADFGDTTPAFFGPGSPRPISNINIFSKFYEVQGRIVGPWAASMIVDGSFGGEASGFHDTGAFLGQRIDVMYEVSTTAALVTWTHKVLRVGAGPARHNIRATQTASAGMNISDSVTHATLGLVALAGLRTSATSHVFVDLGVQYRFVGETGMGPYTPTAFSGGALTTFPATHVGLNNWVLSVGPGIRF